jgi:hypothetical protein
MKNIILPILLFITSTSFSWKKEKEVNTSLLINHWVLIKTKERVDGEYNYNNYTYVELILEKEERYKWIHDENNYEMGSWKIKNTHLGFRATEFNGAVQEGTSYSFNWEIIELDKNKLTLRVQGRHGFVYYYYEPYN